MHPVLKINREGLTDRIGRAIEIPLPRVTSRRGAVTAPSHSRKPAAIQRTTQNTPCPMAMIMMKVKNPPLAPSINQPRAPSKHDSTNQKRLNPLYIVFNFMYANRLSRS